MPKTDEADPPLSRVRALMRSSSLPRPLQWGIVAVSLADSLATLLAVTSARTLESAVQVMLLAACLVLAWRPPWGVLMLTVTMPALLLLPHFSAALVPITLALGIGLAVCSRPLVITFIGAVCAWFVIGLLLNRTDFTQAAGMLVFWLLVAAIGIIARRVAGERHRDRAKLKQLEIERAEVIDAERRAIARELHDVVAHAVSVIAVQARAAKYEKSPDAAQQALNSIGDLSREALADLRRLLRVLASERDPLEEVTEAEWNVFDLRRQLFGLVDTMTSLGIGVEVRLPPTEPELPRSVATAVYRVAQEASTNVIKHAGTEARCTVCLEVEEHQVVLTVFSAPIRQSTDPALSSGFGLDSMRERVHMFDGTLTAGRADDGWQVRAVVPLRV